MHLHIKTKAYDVVCEDLLYILLHRYLQEKERAFHLRRHTVEARLDYVDT